MDASKVFESFFRGMGVNIDVTIFSLIIPFGLGVLFTILCAKNRRTEKIFSWISLPFECVCPPVMLCVLYFLVFPRNKIATLITVMCFTLAFFGYMPARYNRSMSLWRNIVYNGLGLYGAIFKWSFCVGLIGQVDMLKTADVIRARTYTSDYLIVPLVFSVIVIAIIEVARRIIKNSAK